MRVIFTRRARQSLREIGLYIARDNKARAVSFVNELQDRCHKIADTPSAYPLAPEFGPSIRKLVHHHYMILYSIEHETITIRHIVHSARQRRRIN